MLTSVSSIRIQTMETENGSDPHGRGVNDEEAFLQVADRVFLITGGDTAKTRQILETVTDSGETIEELAWNGKPAEAYKAAINTMQRGHPSSDFDEDEIQGTWPQRTRKDTIAMDEIL